MVRWQPNTRERLQKAALDLFAKQGLDGTTVTEIAGRVGVTERTFFRYFADKREVLFSGQEHLRTAFLSAVADAPTGDSPLDVVGAALQAGALLAGRDRHVSRVRSAIIAANPGLSEREHMKLVLLADDVATALRARRVREPEASLAAHAGLAVFHVAFGRWLKDGRNRSLAWHNSDCLSRLIQLGR